MRQEPQYKMSFKPSRAELCDNDYATKQAEASREEASIIMSRETVFVSACIGVPETM